MDKFDKALTLRRRGGILLDEEGDHYVKSYSGNDVYVVSHDGFCSCPALSICSHLLATVFLEALLAVTLLRWAESIEWLDAVSERYGATVAAMPARVRQLVRNEYVRAAERLGKRRAA